MHAALLISWQAVVKSCFSLKSFRGYDPIALTVALGKAVSTKPWQFLEDLSLFSKLACPIAFLPSALLKLLFLEIYHHEVKTPEHCSNEALDAAHLALTDQWTLYKFLLGLSCNLETAIMLSSSKSDKVVLSVNHEQTFHSRNILNNVFYLAVLTLLLNFPAWTFCSPRSYFFPLLMAHMDLVPLYIWLYLLTATTQTVALCLWVSSVMLLYINIFGETELLIHTALKKPQCCRGLTLPLVLTPTEIAGYFIWRTACTG